MGRAADLRLREVLEEVVLDGTGRNTERVHAAEHLLGVIDGRGTRGGDGEHSPGRRVAVRHGSDPDTDPSQHRDELSPGQAAAARAGAGRAATAADELSPGQRVARRAGAGRAATAADDSRSDLRLREALEEVLAQYTGDSNRNAGRGHVRSAQSESSRELVHAAEHLLGVIDDQQHRGGEEDEPSPGRRAAIRRGSDPDDGPGQDDDEPSPGQRAAARARAGRSRSAWDRPDRESRTPGAAFDALGERGGF